MRILVIMRKCLRASMSLRICAAIPLYFHVSAFTLLLAYAPTRLRAYVNCFLFVVHAFMSTQSRSIQVLQVSNQRYTMKVNLP